GNLPADLDVSEWVFWVHGHDRDFRTLHNILMLLASLDRIDTNIAAFEVGPNRCHLRLPVALNGGHADDDRLLEQIGMALRNLDQIKCPFNKPKEIPDQSI